MTVCLFMQRYIFFGLLLGLLVSCAPQRSMSTPAREQPPEATVERWESRRLGYAWTLPSDWEFMPAEEFGLMPRAGLEVTAARKKSDRDWATQLLVTDLVALEAEPTRGPEIYDRLEAAGREFLRRLGVHSADARRLKMSGQDAVEVAGVLGESHFSVRYFFRGHRKFEVRCVALTDASGWPCESAFESLEVADIAAEPLGKPRILHLRDPRYGLEFDAPDDSWFAIGPRTAWGGVQVVWIWRDGKRQIDVGVADLSNAEGPPPIDAFVAKIAKGLRADGSTVAIRRSTLAGLPCHHLAVTKEGEAHVDVLTLNRGKINYTVRVAQPAPDARLLEKVRKGLRIRQGRSVGE